MSVDPSQILLSVPGKTFLVGEYLALDGGPSILLATAPRFELSLASLKSCSLPGGQAHSPELRRRVRRSLPFAKASPAGRFVARHREIFADLDLDFYDPHAGRGGLGASSAQFVLVYMIERVLKNPLRQFELRDFDWSLLLDEYRACAWNGEGRAPSGADVVAQICGGITHFNNTTFCASSLSWTLPDVAFTLIRTGVKLATHEHLKTEPVLPCDELRALVSEVTTSLQSAQTEKFISGVNSVAEVLNSAGLTAEGTLHLLSEIRREKGLALAAKGCGAMGADVICVVHEVAQSDSLRQWVVDRGLSICGSLADLDQGLRIAPSVRFAP